MTKILITGSKGQLGNEISELMTFFPQYQFILTDVEELDIVDSLAIDEFFRLNRPDFVINCAAYTSVDKAESDAKMAFLINKSAPGFLASACNKYHAFLIHISTDYVFDGNHFMPYHELDEPNPSGTYGKSKLEGEFEIRQQINRSVIIRTSWLYSAFGNNFLKTILKLAREKNEIRVVFDQVGSPTYAGDLARTILEILPQCIELQGHNLFHYSNEGVTSWFDFAKAIIEFSNLSCKVIPIESKDYPTPTKRPPYSVLNKAKIKSQFNIEIPYWQDSLKKCLSKCM